MTRTTNRSGTVLQPGRRRRRDRTAVRAHAAAGERSTGRRSARCRCPDPHDARAAADRTPCDAVELHADAGGDPRDRANGYRLSRVGRSSRSVPPRLVHRHRERPTERDGRGGRDAATASRCAVRSPASASASPAAGASDKATTSTSTPRSRPGSTPWPASPHDDAVYIDSLRRRRDLVGARAARRLRLGRRAGHRGRAGARPPASRRPPRSPWRCTTSATASRSTRFNSHGRRARCSCLRVKRFDDHLDGAVGATPRRPRPRRVHPARRGDPSRRRDPRGAGRHAAPAARRALRRVRLRPRLRGSLRRGRRPAGARRGAPSRGRAACASASAPDTDAAALRRVFGTAAHAIVPRVEQLPPIDRPAVPLRAALGGGAAARRSSATERTRERLRDREENR